jgi:hypothetical protein
MRTGVMDGDEQRGPIGRQPRYGQTLVDILGSPDVT